MGSKQSATQAKSGSGGDLIDALTENDVKNNKLSPHRPSSFKKNNGSVKSSGSSILAEVKATEGQKHTNGTSQVKTFSSVSEQPGGLETNGQVIGRQSNSVAQQLALGRANSWKKATLGNDISDRKQAKEVRFSEDVVVVSDQRVSEIQTSKKKHRLL